MSDNAELDAAAIRREARRRRILENSENRLKLITGSVSSLERETITTVADVEVTCDSKDSKHNVFQNPMTLHDSAINDVNDPISQLKNIIKEASLEEDREEFLEKEDVREKTFVDVLIDKRIHYILLAVIVHILLYFNLGYMFYEVCILLKYYYFFSKLINVILLFQNVICPFYTVKLIEMVMLKNKQQNSQSNLFMALMMAGLKPQVVSVFQKIYTLTVGTMADFFLYIFTIVLGSKLLFEIKVE